MQKVCKHIYLCRELLEMALPDIPDMTSQPVVRVAIVDDHPMVRQGLISLIGRYSGIKVEIDAGNGKELVEKLRAARQVPDVCILDISMPEMNGFDTIGVLKKKWPDMGVLVFTVFAQEWYLIRMISYGANGYLLKSCDPDELVKAIISIEKEGVYYSDTETMAYFADVRSNRITLPNITQMEMEVMKLSCTDMSYEDMSVKLRVTKPSVDGFRASLFKKLKVNSRTSLALFAVQSGIVPLEVNENETLFRHWKNS